MKSKKMATIQFNNQQYNIGHICTRLQCEQGKSDQVAKIWLAPIACILFPTFALLDRIGDARADDIYWCTADQAWVMGGSYGIIGPWSAGITQMHYSGNYDAAKWFTLLEQERVNLYDIDP